MKQERHFIVDVLFVLALFGVFAISALILVAIGADVYQHTVQDMTCNYETRTAVSYLTEKMRQNDAAPNGENAACLTSLDGETALMLTRDIGGKTYCTYLYLYEGHLKELFVQQGNSLGGNSLSAGVNIMELDGFQLVQVNPHLLAVEMTTRQGESHSFYLFTHCALQ